jgi:hypothetical protein
MTNEAKLAEMKPVSAAVPTGTVDQRIDWAAMLASRLEVGQKLDFTVYDPATGVSKVAGEVSKVEQIRVPAGTFETIRAVYRIEKLGEQKLTKSWPAKRRRALWFAKISPPGCPPNW